MDSYKEMARLLELQAEAIKGLAAVGEYLKACEKSTGSIANAWYALSKFVMEERDERTSEIRKDKSV